MLTEPVESVGMTSELPLTEVRLPEQPEPLPVKEPAEVSMAFWLPLLRVTYRIYMGMVDLD